MSAVDLAAAADAGEYGGKAAPLAALIRAGFAVPAGFVIPASTYRQAADTLGLDGLTDPAEARRRLLTSTLPAAVRTVVREGLGELFSGGVKGAVAVRSSAVGEDGAVASGAGQHESVLGVRGEQEVRRAVLRCWASLWSERAVAYRSRGGGGAGVGAAAGDSTGGMAVLVQRFVAAEVSGVMFTGGDAEAPTATPVPTLIEAAPGAGEAVVSGRITPESWRVDVSGILEHRAGVEGERCLTDAQVLHLHAFGQQVSTVLGGPRDIEWSIAAGEVWILQARPVTAPVQDPGRGPAGVGLGLRGVPASGGRATGRARVVRAPGDFRSFRPGDVLVCRETDPAWTPLFTVAAAVVTETGGVLSHAAIVAREVGIPAVLAVPDACGVLADGPEVTVDGDRGAVARRMEDPGQRSGL